MERFVQFSSIGGTANCGRLLPNQSSMEGFVRLSSNFGHPNCFNHTASLGVPETPDYHHRTSSYMSCVPFVGGYNATDSASYARALAMIQKTQKRPRSEKKPIPVEQKDPRYFERRMRNNMAAKKSRDSRKAREDQIAIRTSRLEKENAILTIQLATLREEMKTLGTLLIQRRARQQH